MEAAPIADTTYGDKRNRDREWHTAVDSMDSLVVVKTARKMRHAYHVTCTCMVSAGESGLVQPIDKSSNDSAKSFVTRSTGNRKSEVGVSRPRPQVLNGGGHSLTHHPRSPTSYCASPASHQVSAISRLFGMSGQTTATPTTAPVSHLSWSTTHLSLAIFL
jgi:hypothetical protein